MFLQGLVQGWANNGQRQGEGSRNLAKSGSTLEAKFCDTDSHNKICQDAEYST